MAAPAAPRDLYRRQAQVAAASVVATRQAVRAAAASPTLWSGVVDDLLRVMVRFQALSTVTASRAVAAAAGEAPLTVSSSFAGQTSLGYPLTDPLTVLVEDLERQATALAGTLSGQLDTITSDLTARLDRFVAAEVADAGREAAHIEIVGRPEWQNFVRVLNLPSCKRCVVLAGRIYRDLDHFDRHPGCDCQMWPVQDYADARRQGLVTDPREAVESGKVTGLSQADTRAIVEDGADPAQVINATRGTSAPGVTAAIDAEVFGRMVKATTDGTTAKAKWRREHPNLPVRLRPGSIYEHAEDRDDAIRLLKLYGYINDDGPGSRQPAKRDRIDLPDQRSRPDAPEPTPGDGSDGGSPGGPPRPTPSPAPDPDDNDTAAWRARQDAIPLDFKGDQLKPWEVRTVERLLAKGERIDWIGNDRTKSTNDFVWLSKGGVEVEMKSTKPRVETIRTRILDAAIRAEKNHGVIKSRFLIDIEGATLTPQLREQLAGYNFASGGEPRRRYRLTRLWVMSENGRRLEEITLRT